ARRDGGPPPRLLPRAWYARARLARPARPARPRQHRRQLPPRARRSRSRHRPRVFGAPPLRRRLADPPALPPHRRGVRPPRRRRPRRGDRARQPPRPGPRDGRPPRRPLDPRRRPPLQRPTRLYSDLRLNISMEPRTIALQHVEDLWDDAVAGGLDPVERLVYRSNLLGSDWRITNTGGGNTSSKLTETDPITGEPVEVLWVKGSGGDLRTSRKANFASLYQDKVLALQDVYARFPERGLKTPAEDAMVALYPHTTFNLNPRAPSIDTPLHSFIPYKHVDHMHPVAVIAIATAADGPELTKEIYGDEVVWIDWMRPGFELGLAMQRVCREHPEAKRILMGGHGLINWADDDKECYQLTRRLIAQ